jgi:hypothetical protein
MQKYIFQEGNVPDGQKVTYNARDLLDVLSPILPHKQELKDLQEVRVSLCFYCHTLFFGLYALFSSIY